MRPTETETEYIYRICSEKDRIGSWIEVASLLNTNLGYDYSESKYRKDYSSFQRARTSIDEMSSDTPYLDEIRRQKEELQKERVKLQTEKLEYAQMLRETARDEMIADKIVDAIERITPIDYVKPIIRRADQFDTSWVLAFGDEHYGAEFELLGLNGELINKYSPEIFEYRMWSMLDNVAKIVEKENIGTLNVFSLGDFTDGVIRVGQLTKLKYGVVDSTVRYMEFMSNILNELTRFCRVNFHMTDGNHSEIRMFNQQKGAFKDENMGKIVRAYIKARLENNDRFTLVENPSGYIYTTLSGYNVMGVHGEAKDMVREIKDLSNMYGVSIDYLFAGHLHHFEESSCGIYKGVERVPSIVGTCPFSVQLRKVSNPGSIMCAFQEGKGKICEYHINLV